MIVALRLLSATGALVYRGRATYAAALAACALTAVSALSAWGVLYQLVAQVVGLGGSGQMSKGEMLTLAGATAEAGQSRVDMPVAYTGPQIVVSLDHRFVLEFLKVLSPEANIALEIENSETAVVFHADDGAYGYVVMPLSRDR